MEGGEGVDPSELDIKDAGVVDKNTIQKPEHKKIPGKKANLLQTAALVGRMMVGPGDDLAMPALEVASKLGNRSTVTTQAEHKTVAPQLVRIPLEKHKPEFGKQPLKDSKTIAANSPPKEIPSTK